jgi:hypothetical protein
MSPMVKGFTLYVNQRNKHLQHNFTILHGGTGVARSLFLKLFPLPPLFHTQTNNMGGRGGPEETPCPDRIIDDMGR